MLLENLRYHALPLGAGLQEMLVELHRLVDHLYEFRYVDSFRLFLFLSLDLVAGLPLLLFPCSLTSHRAFLIMLRSMYSFISSRSMLFSLLKNTDKGTSDSLGLNNVFFKDQ